jgi:hypothetical protein
MEVVISWYYLRRGESCQKSIVMYVFLGWCIAGELCFNADIQITDSQNVWMYVDKVTENVDIIWPLQTAP